MPYEGVMALPMRVFWHLSGSVDRLWDQEDKRRMELTIAGATPEGAQEMIDILNRRTPEPIQFTEEAVAQAHYQRSAQRDENAGDVLRSLAG